ncbi:NAD-dependent epimerase/dehydratase family protein [Rodentibacter myodis]|uniref:Epimerase n=1 Tax=Rodentibacter myodis TaxID=1907939 RepID=A0A1V3JFT1_9PAST|nr:NAD-dependent epimerase/dehydratase family protein [Rodentibacter myodis]OOF55620.1 epimerase [Rodentibacter myodis]
MSKTVFLAGASGVIGMPLCKMLIEAGYTVFGTTRSAEKAAKLEAMGVKSVIVDVFDAGALEQAMIATQPDIVQHQLTDLPDGLKAEEMAAALVRNARIRDEGTRNLVRAAQKAGAKKLVAQSIGFVYAPSEKIHTEDSPLLDFNEPTYGETAQAVYSLEQQVLNSGMEGVVLRNGWLYGANSGIEQAVDFAPPLHVHAAALAAFLAIDAPKGIYNVADSDTRLDSSKFRQQFPQWSSEFRL